MLSQLGMPPNVVIATLTHQNVPLKKANPAMSPAAKALRVRSPRRAHKSGTRQTNASGSSTPLGKSSCRGPTGKASGKEAAPRSPESSNKPNRRRVRRRAGPETGSAAFTSAGVGRKSEKAIGESGPGHLYQKAHPSDAAAPFRAPQRRRSGRTTARTIPGAPSRRSSSAAIFRASSGRWWSCPKRCNRPWVR